MEIMCGPDAPLRRRLSYLEKRLWPYRREIRVLCVASWIVAIGSWYLVLRC